MELGLWKWNFPPSYVLIRSNILDKYQLMYTATVCDEMIAQIPYFDPVAVRVLKGKLINFTLWMFSTLPRMKKVPHWKVGSSHRWHYRLPSLKCIFRLVENYHYLYPLAHRIAIYEYSCCQQDEMFDLHENKRQKDATFNLSRLLWMWYVVTILHELVRQNHCSSVLYNK